ncbi:LacI family DNA-binding transcriptional regulator [Ancylobacter mangrovi]|uniref:LacI family DNA-binding transcriptional regulator n=1 Tax=Ancylobacter mangrovi TaxID=2972472 RepID=UPI00216130C5|nr:LacI family DNA-binding transcriptional regulator [Ancylobacter mangrovi]MCS0502181.1 LacI family transcriptional regulator [Ancylobacter mangrovi]
MRAPTLADVAALAGVSVSTAGRVLRDQGWPVEESLKERVRAAAIELGYVPNVMARTLRAGAPALVGLVIGNMLDPYYGEIAETVTCYSETTSRMLTMVCNMQRDPRLELDYCRRLWEHRVAGLILAGGGFDQFTYHDDLALLVEKMERSGVIVTTLSPRDLESPAFHTDNVEAGRCAARELIAVGHREIGILVGPIRNRVLTQRVAGITAACEEAGLSVHLVETEFGASWVAPAIAQMFEQRPTITAIVAASGVTSINVIRAVMATGRSVPEDISVIGIGGRAIGEWGAHMTRVDLGLETCGRAALDYIAARVEGRPTAPAFRLEPTIAGGGSVAPPK